MREWVKQMWADTSGQDLIEYALLVGLISLIAIVGVAYAGTQVNLLFNKIGLKIAASIA